MSDEIYKEYDKHVEYCSEIPAGCRNCKYVTLRDEYKGVIMAHSLCDFIAGYKTNQSKIDAALEIINRRPPILSLIDKLAFVKQILEGKRE